MRIVMAPSFEGNQYLELLISHLEKKGAMIERSTTTRPLALFLCDVIKFKADVFHLHWTHPYFLFEGNERFYRLPLIKYACWTFAMLFLVQVYLTTLLCDRVVWTVHNKCNHERRYEVIDKWVSRRLVSIVDIVQVWDENTKHEFGKYLDVSTENMVSVPHGNYLPLYPPEEYPEKEEARTDLDLPQDDRVFLYFGMIRPYKQVPQLIDAWTDLDPMNAHLVVVGNSEYPELTDRIRQQGECRDDVTLNLRYVPDDQVPTYFAACDVGVFPYEHIFSSGSVILAMSMNRAFVAPAKGAISSINPGGNLVYIDDMHESLRTALELEQNALKKIGQENAKAVRIDHDWVQITEQIHTLYQ